MNAAVFLDRDNTLIQNDGDLGDPAQVRLIQGAASAIASLRGLGYKIVVVSNQGGVARGKFTEADVEAVHQRVSELVKATSGATIDRFYFCPYHPQGTVERYSREHAWRKPGAGMLLQAAIDLGIDLSLSWMVGDQARDIEAGAAAGVKTIWLRENAEEPVAAMNIAQGSAAIPQDGGSDATTSGGVAPSFSAKNLIEAVRIIAQKRKPETPEETKARERAARKWDAGSVRAARQNAEAGSARREESPPPASPAPARAIKPFRPWDAPPTEAAIAAATEARNASVTATDAAAPVAPIAPPPSAAPSMTVPEVSIPSSPQAPVISPRQPAADDSASHETLRHILHELRGQRGVVSDFSYFKVLAIILQLIAVVCLLGGLLMGRESFEVFARCLLTGILVQLATLAVLMFER